MHHSSFSRLSTMSKSLLLPWLLCKASLFVSWHAECWLNRFPWHHRTPRQACSIWTLLNNRLKNRLLLINSGRFLWHRCMKGQAALTQIQQNKQHLSHAMSSLYDTYKQISLAFGKLTLANWPSDDLDLALVSPLLCKANLLSLWQSESRHPWHNQFPWRCCMDQLLGWSQPACLHKRQKATHEISNSEAWSSLDEQRNLTKPINKGKW